MNKLKIPKNPSSVTKNLRLPETVSNEIQILANIKNMSYNQVAVSLLKFALENLDDDDKTAITQNKGQI